MCKSQSGSEGQYFKEVCTRQFLKTCILLLFTDIKGQLASCIAKVFGSIDTPSNVVRKEIVF